ncbi:serine/threonine protein kinase PRR1 KNAG_0A06390 [Huiozyma naganishii CBS 8797]|uniref:Protein kinase domain-containing protein n=1 Tax=Huiozyma naganishii (strain ATCC MYA-139 / BCRC 22969 / CBS 8797 / KCTC 17520 / NBRC 10181 / NCYC 3082 / Yp74L-3) TaxID=1071383 RepID=J7RFH0_HUIN7|nr:hypothetical protein KNAG_0A06390 [Kazachstania naganishii CBS 8797]CCK68298.1 hypothetical protein KNAG_0A06390 [Kazachstania naganishii CBS 8797]
MAVDDEGDAADGGTVRSSGTPQLARIVTTNLGGGVPPAQINDENEEQNATATVTTPQLPHGGFDKIQTLPTPMLYTPMSPRIPQGLGIDLGKVGPLVETNNQNSGAPLQQLQVRKRRGPKGKGLQNSQNLDDALKLEHRIVSELVQPVNLSPQRIVSLPTVSEESGFTEKVGAGELGEELGGEFTVGDDSYITGYLLRDLNSSVTWEKVKQIGRGNFSVVKLCHRKLVGEQPKGEDRILEYVAVKQIIYPPDLVQAKRDRTELFSQFESSLTRELSVLQQLHHPCIVQFLAINNPVFVRERTPISRLLEVHGDGVLPVCDIVMSYSKGGDLLNALTERNSGVALPLVQRIFAELTTAVRYLHGRGIVHRDLKLENVLLNYDLQEFATAFEADPLQFADTPLIQLTDFGLCKQVAADELCTARCGSEDYVSPEILMGIPYDGRLSDSWALGVIMYCLLEDMLPFDVPPNATPRQRQRATSHRIARFEWRWFKWAGKPLNAKEIVERTLTRRNQRWNVDDISQTRYIQDVVETLTFLL